MNATCGKFEKQKITRSIPFWMVPMSFFLTELFAFAFLMPRSDDLFQLWPLAFGALWAVLLGAVLNALPFRISRAGFGITYLLALIYAGVQTGYYTLFSEMAWLTDFRYASEGADYADVVLDFPALWWLGLAALLGWGVFVIRKYPGKTWKPGKCILSLGIAAVMGVSAWFLPKAEFANDRSIRYAGSDYGRMQSAQAAYENMFNAHRLYSVCGLYQTFCKDVYANVIYPLTPAYTRAQAAARQEIQGALDRRPEKQVNEMTGRLAGKNVILVLMESMDDWMITEDTPTIGRLMAEGINLSNFYTPVYGGIRTFNTEFCINTGSFLASSGGYAFDYVTNDYSQSLASQLRQEGYSAKTFHYNDPTFYSRGVFTKAMGYEEYVCYADFVPEGKEKKDLLYDDQLLFDNEELKNVFFRPGHPNLNFIITRSAHLSYKYNEVLSHWALKKYPDYKGFTGSEENDCALVKARLVDDLFARLLSELEARGQLDNTVIIGVTDHYTYGYKNMDELLKLSGVENPLLLEKTPCFIWSSNLEPVDVDKILNTADLLPTVLNLLGVDSPYSYIGSDAFDDRYEGFVPFSNGSWIAGNTAFDASTGKYLSLNGEAPNRDEVFRRAMDEKVRAFTRVNNLILDTDYYAD